MSRTEGRAVMSSPECTVEFVSPPTVGAIGVVALRGNVRPTLRALTGQETWHVGRVYLADLAGIDEAIVSCVTDDAAFVLPHGGLRVMQKLRAWFDNSVHTTWAHESQELENDRGQWERQHGGREFPEAKSVVEELMLRVLSTARSPLAIDLLLAQPARWSNQRSEFSEEDIARSERLNRLLLPPLVVLVGPANVGKSTLMNRLLGRDAMISADFAGTTRDYAAVEVDCGGLVVTLVDTAGVRQSSDLIEQESIGLAASLLESADLVLHMTDHEQPWLTDHELAIADVSRIMHIRNKCDLVVRSDAELAVSAESGAGVDRLVRAVRERLVPTRDLQHPGRWVFHPCVAEITLH